MRLKKAEEMNPELGMQEKPREKGIIGDVGEVGDCGDLGTNQPPQVKNGQQS